MIVILMGVSGSGKTTIGARLAAELGWRFLDADDFHPVENIRRMSEGIPLTDEDRQPWVARLHDELARTLAAREDAILACSALKAASRDRLAVDLTAVRFGYLKGTEALIRERLRSRSGHFMKADMLASQFAALEEPRDALTIDVDDRPRRIVERIRTALRL